MKRNIDTVAQPERPRPLPGAIDDNFGVDGTRVSRHRLYAPVFDNNSRNLRAFENSGAAVARALGQGLGQVRRIGFSITGKP